MNQKLQGKFQITVDDVGYDSASNRLVEEAVEAGVVQNLAVMTTMPGSAEALSQLAKWQKRHPALQIGLHLNFTEGQPLSKPSEIPSLLQTNGTFWPWSTFLVRSAIRQIEPDHICIEANRQYEHLAKAVPVVDFMNSHHHVHLWPAVAQILAPLLPTWHVWAVRRPQRFHWPAAALPNLPKAILIQWFGLRVSYPLISLTAVYADLDWAGPDPEHRQRFLNQIPPGTELGCHPHAFLGGESSLEWLLKYKRSEIRD